jgi:hypothetical protein
MSNRQARIAIQAGFPLRQTSTNTTITDNDFTIEVTSGSPTITLPTAVGRARYIFQIVNSGTGSPIIATTGGQTIQGETSFTLYEGENLTVQSNGTNYIVVM